MGGFLGRGAAAVALVLCCLPVPGAAARAKDGPVVVQADPFTAGAPGLARGQIELTTVSTRPAIVSGDRARVEVRGLAPGEKLTVKRDGADVSDLFAPSRPGVRDGVVTGLHEGVNRLVASAQGQTARLAVTAHSLQGPIISGPHQYPFGCQTEKSGLGKPTSKDCEAPARVHWYARGYDGSFTLLSDPYAPYPPLTAITTVNGKRVPFVVRVQSRVINRSVARIAVLDDPHARGRDTPFKPLDWNHKLLFQFGESCGTGYHQGSNTETSAFGQLQDIGGENLAGPFLDLGGHLGQGWMVAVSTLTIFGVHCNPVLSAETLMMIKEHIIDDYGSVDHLVSAGASGGAIQQYTIANQYPGVIDAGVPILSFPDVATTAMTVGDCIGLRRVFDSDSRRWNDAKVGAITGLATTQVCKDWVSLFGDNIKPTSCDGSVPKDQRYDADKNPHGVRCDIQDSARNVYGVDPDTGIARRPLDNIGVQYGLAALRRGDISLDDFLTLNRDVGGLDADGNHQSARHAMSEATAKRLFADSQVTGRGALDQTPIIDVAIPVSDVTPELDIHDQIRPFGLRARLDDAFGSHASQAIWTLVPLPSSAVDTAEAWLRSLDALRARHPALSREQLVAQGRPASAADQCRLGVLPLAGLCDDGLLRHSSPRQQAGAPFSEDVVKCQRKAVDARDYPASLTAAQLGQIRALFAGGVCDWSKPSVGAVQRSTTWLAYGDPDKQQAPRAIGYPIARSGPTPKPRHVKRRRTS
jgi:hypothetical protein